MPDESNATEPLSPHELAEVAEVAEYLDEPLASARAESAVATATVTPGGPPRFARMTGSSIAGRHASRGKGNVVRRSMLQQLALRIA